MRLSDFIDESNRAGSTESILALMEHAADDLGFDRYAYCALTRHDRYEAGGNAADAASTCGPPLDAPARGSSRRFR